MRSPRMRIYVPDEARFLNSSTMEARSGGFNRTSAAVMANALAVKSMLDFAKSELAAAANSTV